MNNSEYEQNEKLQEIKDQFNIKLKEKDEDILKVSLGIILVMFTHNINDCRALENLGFSYGEGYKIFLYIICILVLFY